VIGHVTEGGLWLAPPERGNVPLCGDDHWTSHVFHHFQDTFRPLNGSWSILAALASSPSPPPLLTMSILDFQLPVDHSPSIPNSLAGSSLDIPYSLLSDSYDVPYPASSTRRRTVYSLSSSPSYMPASPRLSLVSVFQEQRILANFLRYIKWHDFRSLALTCTACRNVLHHPKLRNVVLSAFVPGFRYCLRHADLDSSEDIGIQFHDLNDFSECDTFIYIRKYATTITPQ
jgi:hypothetical protein